MFTGVHERQLDERGRVALPPSFRSSIGERCYLTFGDSSCVKVMSEATFQEEADEMVARVKSGEMTMSRQRAYASSVVTISPDKQGRLLLDPKLRDYAGIDAQSAVILLGNLTHIEIWAPAKYESEEAAGTTEMAGTR